MFLSFERKKISSKHSIFLFLVSVLVLNFEHKHLINLLFKQNILFRQNLIRFLLLNTALILKDDPQKPTTHSVTILNDFSFWLDYCIRQHFLIIEESKMRKLFIFPKEMYQTVKTFSPFPYKYSPRNLLFYDYDFWFCDKSFLQKEIFRQHLVRVWFQCF